LTPRHREGTLEPVRAFFFSVLEYFLTPIGVVCMGVLDASLVFFLPLGIDFVVIVMAARRPELFWLYALLATLGSALGAAVSFWIGRKVGEVGLTRFVSAKRLKRIKSQVSRGAVVAGALALIPPPFPFTPFVVTSGALGMDPRIFLATLAACRALRFGLESALAARYGSQILRWMKTPSFEIVIGALILLALIGTAISAIAIVRASNPRTKRALT
jgi:membrane protein YqaA with SNARE-associated domain